MKRFSMMKRGFGLSLILLLAVTSTLGAQGKGKGGGGNGGSGGGGSDDSGPAASLAVGYRTHIVETPAYAPVTGMRSLKLQIDSTGAPVALIGVSWYTRASDSTNVGYVYVHPLDPSEQPVFLNLHDLVPSFPSWVPSTHVQSKFRDVNSNGRICGDLLDGNGDGEIPFYIDLNDTSRTISPLPFPSSASIEARAERINETGDVLVVGKTADGEQEYSIVTPATSSTPLISTLVPIEFADRNRVKFNSSLVIIGDLADGTVVRHRVRDVDQNGVSDLETPETEFFTDLYDPSGINERSQFSCTREEMIRKNKWKLYATRIEANSEIGWQYYRNDLADHWRAVVPYDVTGGINDSGDVWYQRGSGSEALAYYYHAGNEDINGDPDEILVYDFFDMIIDDANWQLVSNLGGRVSNAGTNRVVLDPTDDRKNFGCFVVHFDGGIALLIPELLP